MRISKHRIAALLMLSSALPIAANAQNAMPTTPAPSATQCLALPIGKVAIQAYVFASQLAGVTIPPEWDSLPIDQKFSNIKPLGAKLMSVRPTDEQIAAVLKAIAAIGYRNIEGMDLISDGNPAAYDRLLKENGLHAVASHTSLDKEKWPAELAAAKARGQKFIGSGGFGKPGFATLDDVRATAANLNELGKAAAAEGLTLYVHNHTGEFDARFPYDRGDGKPVMTSAWEIVAAETDPRYVQFEVDVFWARLGLGPDKVAELDAFLRKYRDRIPLLHMKDLAANGAVTDMGHGTTDWRRIVEAAGPQIAYYIFEYDFPSDPLKAARTGFDYLTCGPGTKGATAHKR